MAPSAFCAESAIQPPVIHADSAIQSYIRQILNPYRREHSQLCVSRAGRAGSPETGEQTLSPARSKVIEILKSYAGGLDAKAGQEGLASIAAARLRTLGAGLLKCVSNGAEFVSQFVLTRM